MERLLSKNHPIQNQPVFQTRDETNAVEIPEPHPRNVPLKPKTVHEGIDSAAVSLGRIIKHGFCRIRIMKKVLITGANNK